MRNAPLGLGTALLDRSAPPVGHHNGDRFAMQVDLGVVVPKAESITSRRRARTSLLFIVNSAARTFSGSPSYQAIGTALPACVPPKGREPAGRD